MVSDARPLIPKWVTRDSAKRYELSTLQWAVLICMWDHADRRTFLTDWGREQIATETGAKWRAVHNAMKALRGHGLIVVHAERPGQSTVYALARQPPSTVRFH